MSPVEAVLTGVALSAAAGFRTFLPLLAAGFTFRLTGFVPPEPLSWAGTDVGLTVLGAAAVVEILADKVPVLDNVLDAGYTALRPLAGLLLTVGFAAELPAPAAWALGLLVGAPTALGVHATRATARGASTGLTGGTANPLLSLLDDVAAILIVVLAVLLPIAALVLVAVGAVAAARWWRGRRGRRAAPR